jgi:hypothetical protein
LLTGAQKDAAKRVLLSGSEKARRVTICELGEHHVQPTPSPHPRVQRMPHAMDSYNFLGGVKGPELEAEHPVLSCVRV